MSRSKKKNGSASAHNGPDNTTPNNVKEVAAPVNKPVSTLGNDFRHFIKHASISAIRRFLSLTSTTNDGANLQLFWDRAFSEGKQTRSDDDYQRGHSDGYDEGHADGFESAFNEAAEELFPEDAEDKDYVPDVDAVTMLCNRAMESPARTPLGALWRKAFSHGRLEGFGEGMTKGFEEGKKEGTQEGFDTVMEARKEAENIIRVNVSVQADDTILHPPSPTRVHAAVQVDTPSLVRMDTAVQVEEAKNCLEGAIQVGNTSTAPCTTISESTLDFQPGRNNNGMSTFDWADDAEGLSFDPLFPTSSLPPVDSHDHNLTRPGMSMPHTKKAPVAYWGDVKAVWDCTPQAQREIEVSAKAKGEDGALPEITKEADGEVEDDDESIIVISNTPRLPLSFLSPSKKPPTATQDHTIASPCTAPLLPPGLGLECTLKSTSSTSKLLTKARSALPQVYAQVQEKSAHQSLGYTDSKALKGWVKEQLDARKWQTRSESRPERDIVPTHGAGEEEDADSRLPGGRQTGANFHNPLTNDRREVTTEQQAPSSPHLLVKYQRRHSVPDLLETVTHHENSVRSPSSLPQAHVPAFNAYQCPMPLVSSTSVSAQPPPPSPQVPVPLTQTKDLKAPQKPKSRSWSPISRHDVGVQDIVIGPRMLATSSVSMLNWKIPPPQECDVSNLHRISDSNPTSASTSCTQAKVPTTAFSSLQYRSKRFKIRNCSCQRYRTRGGGTKKTFDDPFPHPSSSHSRPDVHRGSYDRPPHGPPAVGDHSGADPSLSWESDPRLVDLSRCLRALGWVRGR